MTSEQQVILLLSLVGAFWAGLGLWTARQIDREERRDQGRVHPAE